MSLANLIALVSSVNVDPNTVPETDVSPEIVETVIGRNLPKPMRGQKQAAPIHVVQQPTSVKTKLNAQDFITAMRKARTRDESIAAIMSYTNYTWSQVTANFGSIDHEARAKAQREIRAAKGYSASAGLSREEKRSAERSMSGFVAGMPKPQQRIVLDLQARAVSLAESRDNAKTDAERAQYQTLLNATNEALSQMGF